MPRARRGRPRSRGAGVIAHACPRDVAGFSTFEEDSPQGLPAPDLRCDGHGLIPHAIRAPRSGWPSTRRDRAPPRSCAAREKLPNLRTSKTVPAPDPCGGAPAGMCPAERGHRDLQAVSSTAQRWRSRPDLSAGSPRWKMTRASSRSFEIEYMWIGARTPPWAKTRRSCVVVFTSPEDSGPASGCVWKY